jgi:hypothetical protein
MPRPPLQGGGPLPRWLIAVGSAAILYHLAAIIIPILDAPSGPWVTGEGPRPAEAPAFAHSAADLAKVHADYLRLAHSYHFVTNRPGDIPGVQFEVHLKNTQGEEIAKLYFPDKDANPWVRHRQELLASALAPDLPMEQQGGEVIPAAGEKVRTVSIWALPSEDLSGNNPMQPPPPADRNTPLHLVTLPQHRVPRNRMAMRPSDWALVLVHSYARYLCSSHGAASAEIVRHTREPVPPAVLFGGDVPPPVFKDLVANFGEMTP